MERIWYFHDGRTEQGPFSVFELGAAGDKGLLRPDSPVRRNGDAQWRPAREVVVFGSPAVRMSGRPGDAAPASSWSPVQPTSPSGAPAPGHWAPVAPVKPIAPVPPTRSPEAAAVQSTSPPLPIAESTAAPVASMSPEMIARGWKMLQMGLGAAGATLAVGIVAVLLARPVPKQWQTPSRPTVIVDAHETPLPAQKAATLSIPGGAVEPNYVAKATASPTATRPFAAEIPAPSQAAPLSRPAPVAEPAPAPASAAKSNGATTAATTAAVSTQPATKPERSSLADLAPPAPSGKQRASFDTRIRRLGEMHALHLTSFASWSALEKERAPLARELKVVMGRIALLQGQIALTQARLVEANAALTAANLRVATSINSTTLAAARDSVRYWEGQVARFKLELSGLNIKMNQEQQTAGVLQGQIAVIVNQQAPLIAAVDGTGAEWIRMSDPFGKLSSDERRQVIGLFDRWIGENSAISMSHLGRAFARLPTGYLDAAVVDAAEAARLDPRLSYASQAIRGYVLVRNGEVKKGLSDLNSSVREAGKQPLPALMRGMTWIEQGEYHRAEDDFTKAVRFGDSLPEAHEMLARLLAQCPQESILAGRRAVESAKKACELSQFQDWRSLETLASAHAQDGDYRTALQHLFSAMELAPADFQSELQSRMQLYQSEKPYRFAAATPPR